MADRHINGDQSLVHDFDNVQARLAAHRDQFGHLEGVELIRSLDETFGDEVAAITSFGANAPLLLDQAAQVKPDMAVYTADAGGHKNLRGCTR